MIFSDLPLSRRLERAEGFAAAQFAQARARLSPESGSEWIEFAGTYAIFDGVDSPVTQTFGLGVFEEPNTETLSVLEHFFLARGAAVMHEVSPLAGVTTSELLCSRGYRPIEISSVLYLPVEKRPEPVDSQIQVRRIEAEEADLWVRVSAEGWAHEHPELLSFLLSTGAVISQRAQTYNFLAEIEGKPGAAGTLCLHEGTALFGGATTIPTMRRRGLQGALLEARLRFAAELGCDLAMMVAEVGSSSQRNAERQGFRIAYTRTKWRLQP